MAASGKPVFSELSEFCTHEVFNQPPHAELIATSDVEARARSLTKHLALALQGAHWCASRLK